MTSICEMVDQLIQKKQEEKHIQEDQAANARYWKIPAYIDDDDDYNFPITPNETVDSLNMGDKHLDTVPATESDEFIKSSVENLVPNPSQHHFNAESELIESLLNHDSSIIPSFSKIDSLLDEFAELLDNYSLPIPENESFHFDIPLFSRPLAKPPDGNTRLLNIKMMGDVSDQKVPIPKLTITLVSNQEKSPDLLFHRGFENLQPSAECPMKIHGKNIPTLDVPRFHFYP
nr:hypothetical protein [Tanacetum cinerariifolium]